MIKGLSGDWRWQLRGRKAGRRRLILLKEVLKMGEDSLWETIPKQTVQWRGPGNVK